MKYGSGGVQKNDVESFWAKVDVRGERECWPWKEGLWDNGYGRFKHNYKSWRAHRFALELVKGMAPLPDMLALHSCHNRKCCNPNHLNWGTHADNMEARRMRYLPAHNRFKKLKDGVYV